MSENTGYNFCHKKVINDPEGIRIKKTFSAIFPFESNFALLSHLKVIPPEYLPYLALDMQEKIEGEALEMMNRRFNVSYEEKWWHLDGTYVNFGTALKKHASEAAFCEYCLKKHDPLTEKIEELPKSPARGEDPDGRPRPHFLTKTEFGN